MTSYYYATLVFNTPEQAVSASVYDYLTACGNGATAETLEICGKPSTEILESMADDGWQLKYAEEVDDIGGLIEECVDQVVNEIEEFS